MASGQSPRRILGLKGTCCGVPGIVEVDVRDGFMNPAPSKEVALEASLLDASKCDGASKSDRAWAAPLATIGSPGDQCGQSHTASPRWGNMSSM